MYCDTKSIPTRWVLKGRGNTTKTKEEGWLVWCDGNKEERVAKGASNGRRVEDRYLNGSLRFAQPPPSHKFSSQQREHGTMTAQPESTGVDWLKLSYPNHVSVIPYVTV